MGNCPRETCTIEWNQLLHAATDEGPHYDIPVDGCGF